MEGWPDSYIELLMRGDPGDAMSLPMSQLLTGGGLAGVIALLLILAAIVCVLMGLSGRRGASGLGVMFAVVAVLCTFGGGYFGWREADAVVKAKSAAITSVDIADGANRILGPFLWSCVFFVGVSILAGLGLVLGKKE